MATLALLASTVVLAVILVRTNNSLKSTQSMLSTTQSDLKVARANLTKSQTSLTQTLRDLGASAAVSQYASVVVDRSFAILSNVAGACTSQGADCAKAVADQSAAVDGFRSRLASLTAPPQLQAADTQFRQAIDLLSTALPKMATTNAANDAAGFTAGITIANQGLDHLRQGMVALINALASSP